MAETLEVSGVEVPRPDKELFPDDGLTKADLARYHATVAEAMLPHLAGRPVNMQRFPDGIGGQGFYEKRLPGHFPDWAGRVRVGIQSARGAAIDAWLARLEARGVIVDQATLTDNGDRTLGVDLTLRAQGR